MGEDAYWATKYEQQWLSTHNVEYDSDSQHKGFVFKIVSVKSNTLARKFQTRMKTKHQEHLVVRKKFNDKDKKIYTTLQTISEV